NKISTVELAEDFSSDSKEELIGNLRTEEASKQLEVSAVGVIGKLIEPLVQPLGFDWRLGISLVSGIAAKEIVVSTMGTLYSLGDSDENSTALREKLLAIGSYNIPVALSFMVFVLLYIPCFAASIVFHREAGKIKWTFLYIFYTMTVAWIMSFATYNIASLFL
ncbi:MAG: ferrous iron transport protein B, partial [Bacteroidetes bacterium]|nr:ferrous iron transport protein B [Bacteroidota bacterium]